MFSKTLPPVTASSRALIVSDTKSHGTSFGSGIPAKSFSQVTTSTSRFSIRLRSLIASSVSSWFIRCSTPLRPLRSKCSPRLHIGTLSYLRNGKPCGHREWRSWPLFSRPVHLATLDSCLSLGEVGVPNRAGFVRENLWQVFLQNCVNLLCYSANTCVSGIVFTLRDEL